MVQNLANSKRGGGGDFGLSSKGIVFCLEIPSLRTQIYLHPRHFGINYKGTIWPGNAKGVGILG